LYAKIAKSARFFVFLFMVGLSCAPTAVDVAVEESAEREASEKLKTVVPPLGHVKTEEDVRNGFGFAVKGYGIITCAHIAKNDTMIFQPVTGTTDMKMVLKEKLEAFDLATYQIIGEAMVDEYETGDFAALRPYDTVMYFGWEPAKLPRLKILRAVVSATGNVARRNESLHFIDFAGIMNPGYSGGPVLNREGKIVAIASECAIVKGLKSSTEESIIRAFSLEPLR